jgi:hypothetical protein
MEDKMKKLIFITLFFPVFVVSLLQAAPQVQATFTAAQLEKEITHTIILAPHFGVFDALFYKLDGQNVTLLGQVLLPITKAEVFRRISKLPDIGKVTNKIEVLPLSPDDDSIRFRVYRRLFGTADLYRYALGPNPSIHIIVKGGHVTLEGVVANEEDSRIANLAVHQVAGKFSVTNNLKIEK